MILRRFLLALILALLPVGGFAANAAAEAVPRNVLLVVFDDLSPHLSFLGTPGIETPNFDRLAREGVYFESAFATAASCAPARTSILTGMYPHSHGTWRNVHTPPLNSPEKDFGPETSVRDAVGIGPDIPTLVELLREAGVYTGITQKLHLSPVWRYPFEGRDAVQSTPEGFRAALSRMLREAGERPFFIQANIAAPHRPYHVHLNRNPEHPLPDADRIALPPFLPELPAVRRDMQRYFASAEIGDACLGAILEALEASGRAGETLIIATSDHGMPIHHAKASAYPGGTHIPLAVTGLGVDGERRVSAPVSQVDFMPTILETMGLEVPPEVEGLSLWPVLEGGATVPGRRYVFAEHNSHGPARPEHFPQRAITDGRWYLVQNLRPEKAQLLPADLRGVEPWGNEAYQAIVDHVDAFPFQSRFLTRYADPPRPETELFFLEGDPWGLFDLADDPATTGVLRRMQRALDAWREATGDIKASPTEIPGHGDGGKAE